MFRFTLDCPLILYQIEIPTFWENFGQACGEWRAPWWKEVLLFIHRPRNRHKWSTRSWYIFFEDIAARIVSFWMNNYIMCSMHKTKHCICLHQDFHLKFYLGTCWSLHWIWFLGKMLILMRREMNISPEKSYGRSRWYIKQCRNNWRRVKPSIRLGMINTRWITISKLVIKFGYASARIG